MNNPFVRLKHYLRDEINPQENHATECLAACLVFSARIRRKFIQFLIGNETEIPLNDSPEVQVVTQHQTDTGGYIDLVLLQEGKFVVAVEVKVKSSENSDHHRAQLRDYRKWLDDHCKTNGYLKRYLFTLVRNEDDAFRPQQHGANDRRSWWGLHKHFQEMLRADNLSDVEISLIENLFDYLESEGIVSTYETKDLLSYEAGLKARKAVTGIFNQVASRLEMDGYKTVSSEDKKGAWPQLKIQHPRWKRIFGKGDNWKISLWFCVPGIWEADRHEFSFEIELWHEQHRNDWGHAIARLPKWLKKLKSQNFDWAVYQTWNKFRNNTPARDIQSQPKRIHAWKSDGQTLLNQVQFPSEDELVKVLTVCAKQYAEIVESLDA